MALRELGGDVHDKRGAGVGESGRVKNFVRAEGFARDGELFEAGEETAFVAESRGVVVVGMASFPVGGDDSAGAEFANGGGEAEFVLTRALFEAKCPALYHEVRELRRAEAHG